VSAEWLPTFSPKRQIFLSDRTLEIPPQTNTEIRIALLKSNPKISNAVYVIEMKDDDALPTTTANTKKESSDLSLFGKGRYKFWALAAILLLAFWSMFTGTVTLRWSAGNLNRLSADFDIPIHDDLDVLVSICICFLFFLRVFLGLDL
jgi:hypothetical protein